MSPVRLHKWSFDEERALVEFVGLALMDLKYCIQNEWPAFRPGHFFWSDSARHIRESTGSSVLLTSEYMFSVMYTIKNSDRLLQC